MERRGEAMLLLGWRQEASGRENFNTESNREEAEVERERTLMHKHKKEGRVRHKAQSEVAFYGVA